MPASTHRNPFFRGVIVLGAVFVITVLAMLAATFGDPEAPPNRFFNAYGLQLVAGETALLLAVSFIALVVDRRQTLADLANHSGQSPTVDESGATQSTAADQPPSHTPGH